MEIIPIWPRALPYTIRQQARSKLAKLESFSGLAFDLHPADTRVRVTDRRSDRSQQAAKCTPWYHPQLIPASTTSEEYVITQGLQPTRSPREISNPSHIPIVLFFESTSHQYVLSGRPLKQKHHSSLAFRIVLKFDHGRVAVYRRHLHDVTAVRDRPSFAEHTTFPCAWLMPSALELLSHTYGIAGTSVFRIGSRDSTRSLEASWAK